MNEKGITCGSRFAAILKYYVLMETLLEGIM